MKKIFIAYFLILHVILCVFIYDPYLILSQRWRLGLHNVTQPFKEHLFYKDFLGISFSPLHKTNIILGASHMRRFDHMMLDKKFVNLAISGQKIEKLQENIERLKLPQRLGHVLLLIGGNDILHGKKNAEFVFEKTKNMIQFMENADHFLLVTLPPVGKNLHGKMGQEIIKLNDMFRSYCAAYGICTIIDIYPELVADNGLLHTPYNAGDDLHLSFEAYYILQEKINKALDR